MAQHEDLIRAAEDARKLCYAPYSGVSVGAALLCASGELFSGANIENASYSATICAERVALARAIAAGEREFTAMAIVGGPRDEEAREFFYPCGSCRQWLAEFCGPEFVVIVAKSAAEFQQFSLGELLPHSFGPAHLR